MTPKTRSSKQTNQGKGVEDVTRAVRVLARNSRDLLADAGDILERELAMAVAVSERLRDQAVSEELLAEARNLRFQAGVRDSAHRVVDLVADAVGVATISVIRYGEAMVDEPRPDVRVKGETVAAASA